MIYLSIPLRRAADEDSTARILAGETIGLEERKDHILAYYESREAAGRAASLLADLAPRLVEEPDRDWQAEWQRHWKPFAVGERFFLAPEWDDSPTPPNRIRLAMHSGMAFGSGDHATTQLGLLALEQRLRPGDRVLDYGAGSAILMIAALRLGASLAVGAEIDPVTGGLARQYLRAEALPANLVLAASNPFVAEQFNLVVANISPHAAKSLAGEIKRVLRPGGHAFVGGFGAEDQNAVRDVHRKAGLTITALDSRAEWRLLTVSKNA